MITEQERNHIERARQLLDTIRAAENELLKMFGEGEDGDFVELVDKKPVKHQGRPKKPKANENQAGAWVRGMPRPCCGSKGQSHKRECEVGGLGDVKKSNVRYKCTQIGCFYYEGIPNNDSECPRDPGHISVQI